jgi:hypothetical protein
MMIRRTIAVVAATAALLVGSSPASAEPTWSTELPCATGEIASRWVGEDDQGRTTTWLSGSIEPCGPAAASERLGFIYYVRHRDAPSPHGYVFYGRLRPYSPGQTSFAGTIDPEVEERHGTLLGVCLAYGPGRPVDCVQPEPSTTGGPPRPPLPAIADLAGLPVSVIDPSGTQPNCATCV